MELIELKKIRQGLGWTQQELAKRTGFSQSFIAKIESGQIDPTYSRAKKILDVLAQSQDRRETPVSQVMTRKLISINASASLSEAARLLSMHAISQLPVISGKQIIGMVSESTLLECLSIGKNPSGVKVEEMMSSAPPVFPSDTPVRAIQDVLRIVPLVIITERGSMAGVVTKSNILSHLKNQ